MARENQMRRERYVLGGERKSVNKIRINFFSVCCPYPLIFGMAL